MKRTKVQRFIGVDARDAGELAELLTEKCEEFKEFCPDIKWIDGRSRHNWRCERRKKGTDIDFPACVTFYEELERGEIFE